LVTAEEEDDLSYFSKLANDDEWLILID
jgi:hypothetical protein